MKQFLNVLSFELSNYFKNKGYMITTILFSILLIIGLSLPSFFNMSKLIPQLDQNSTESIESVEEISEEDKKSFVIIDNNNIFENLSDFTKLYAIVIGIGNFSGIHLSSLQ